MIIADAVENRVTSPKTRRARVVVLGEFSAGKSTLINLLTGARSLRTQVTATQMPAVWMSHGTRPPYRVDLDGVEHPVDPSDPASISVSDTAFVRTFMETPALELCDFIDTPGNSDPNIASVAWERVAELADVAIWCSPTTQAWRQSELAAWQDVPERVRKRSMLLLTRSDKLTSDSDRDKVLKRVTREAGDLFTTIHMASLLNFANARDVLRDLIDLCNSVDEAAKNEADRGTDVLQQMVVDAEPASTGATPAPDAPETATQAAKDIQAVEELQELALTEELERDADDVLAAFMAPAAPSTPEPAEAMAIEGYASGLWAKMSFGVPADDPDAVAAAFDLFLERLDSEIEALGKRASMKAAG